MQEWIGWTLYGVLFVYNLLDVHQTKLLLSVGAKEINPIMRFFIQNFGENSMYSVKIFIFAVLGILLLINKYTYFKV